MRQAHSKSSFNGIIDEIPDISVDNFDRMDRKAYFLSHCHKDHTQGLFNDILLKILKKNGVFIYMSELTADIIMHESRSKRKDIADCIKPLDIGSTTITIPGDKKNDSEKQYISVEVIQAGHCFGSVMFLFKTIYKTILYTGDFRISQNSVSKYGQLHDKGNIIKIDALYIDTTFHNVSNMHDNFPKRTESVRVVVRHIEEWLGAKETNQVALYTPAKYGYEFVFKEIYKTTNQKVYVSDDKWLFYSQYPNLVPGVTNNLHETRIHSCKNRRETETHGPCFPGTLSFEGYDFLFVYFTAFKWSDFEDEQPMIEIKTGRIDVCFATHCSKSEIDYFVNYLSPKKVVGFPKEYVRGDVAPATPGKRLAPRSVEKKSPEVKVARIIDKSTIRKMFSD